MKIILQQDVAKVGREGDIVTVADGFARNYLIPRSLAVTATGGALKMHQARTAREAQRSEETKTQAEQAATALTDKTVTVSTRAGETDRLYGSITSQDIADAIKSSLGVTVDKRKIHLADPIKALGTYTVPVKLHKDIAVNLNVEVVKASA